jgi:ribonuclease BN (tRNA processing enzyme)
VKIKLLPTSFDETGAPSQRQHLSCFVVNDSVALDAGSLAMAATPVQRAAVRDIVLTHAHLDHIAGLPLFIDDLFANLREPVRVFATREVIEILERDIFNWSVYPRFTELNNEFGPVLQYVPIEPNVEFVLRGLNITPVEVNHNVPAVGLIVSDGRRLIGVTGDTAETTRFWSCLNDQPKVDALFVECAFPGSLDGLATVSHHLTPGRLRDEIDKLSLRTCPVYVINLKPMYRDEIVSELSELDLTNVFVMDVGRTYEL